MYIFFEIFFNFIFKKETSGCIYIIAFFIGKKRYRKFHFKQISDKEMLTAGWVRSSGRDLNPRPLSNGNCKTSTSSYTFLILLSKPSQRSLLCHFQSPMESVNVLKGYGKVSSNLENQNLHRSKIIRRSLIFSALFLTLIIGLMLALLIHESNTESPESGSDSPSLSSASNSVNSIKTVCSVTRYPASCFTSIHSLNASIKPDPEAIFKVSLQVSIKELKNVSPLFRTLNDAKSQAAINDCLSLFDDSLSRLNDSLLAMEVGPEEKALTLEKINDIQTWISAAMSDQQTCEDGLEEMGSMVLDEVKAKMENSKEFLSNSLAIVAQMQNLLEKFDLKMH